MAALCRREEVRNRDGIPLLKRGSRGKGAAFPLQSVSVPPAVVRSSKQGQNLRLQVAALQIMGLKQVLTYPTWLKRLWTFLWTVVRLTSRVNECKVHGSPKLRVWQSVLHASASMPDSCRFLLWQSAATL